MLSDFKNFEKQGDNSNFIDQSLVLDPHFDIHHVSTNENIFNSDGYIEEEDDDQFPSEVEEVLNFETKIGEILTIPEQLNIILTTPKYKDQKFRIKLKRQDYNNGIINVISPDFMRVILKFLFDELNDALLECSDNCAEDRRKFFETNFNNYKRTIEHYIEEKNKLFSCVLANLFMKISITQEDFDNSVTYYINFSEETNEVFKIREQYDKLYNVGKKEM